MAGDLNTPEKPAAIFLPAASVPPEVVRAVQTLAADRPFLDDLRDAVEVLRAVAGVRKPGYSLNELALSAAALAAAVSSDPKAADLVNVRVRTQLRPQKPLHSKAAPKAGHGAPSVPVKEVVESRISVPRPRVAKGFLRRLFHQEH